MSLNNLDFDYVCRLIHAHSAIALEADKGYLVESRLILLARREGFASPQQLVARLRSEPFNGLHQKVVEAMANNETTFFRDLYPFEALKKAILPGLLEKRAAERRLNLWSSACSSGQESYSVAMLLCESFPVLANWTVQFVASDISGEMLSRAREGYYSQLEVNRGLPAALLVKYFHKQGLQWQIKDELRQMVEFRQINLAEAWPLLPSMDIILMRNVLIYFDLETKKDILSRVRRLLRPDGYLLLGAAETMINLDDSFARTTFDRAGCYRLRVP